ncbi:MAG: hypothetical protein DRJ68_06880 [Thermoprotei archaeon]|nr:MAG: hypothetical protein DRJ62_04935 [Thermoprotei archaeon]RLF18353.1 MAG: hypothetical protein DRJ68_06880 [Thermoprotei archaeon]
MSRVLGALLVLSAGVCWGTAGVLGKLTMELGYSPLTVVAYRLSIGFVILLAVAYAWRGKRLLAVDRGSLSLLALAGVLGVGFGTLFYFYAVDLIGASLAVVLLYTAPIFTLITASPSLREKISAVKVVSVVLVFVGCYLAVKGYDLSYVKVNYTGIIVGLLAGLFYSIYIVSSKKAMNRGASTFTVMTFTVGFGALAIFVADLATGFCPIVFTLYSTALILALAVIPTALANLLFVLGLNLTEAGRANVYSTVEAVTAVILAFLVLGERLEPLQVLGCVAVIGSIAMLYSFEATQRA